MLLFDSVTPVTAARSFGEVEREAAPARADVEHLMAGLGQELRRDVAFLGELGIVEALSGDSK